MPVAGPQPVTHTTAEALAAPGCCAFARVFGSVGGSLVGRLPLGPVSVETERHIMAADPWRAQQEPLQAQRLLTVHTVIPSQWPFQDHVSMTQDGSCQSYLARCLDRSPLFWATSCGPDVFSPPATWSI